MQISRYLVQCVLSFFGVKSGGNKQLCKRGEGITTAHTHFWLFSHKDNIAFATAQRKCYCLNWTNIE